MAEVQGFFLECALLKEDGSGVIAARHERLLQLSRTAVDRAQRGRHRTWPAYEAKASAD